LLGEGRYEALRRPTGTLKLGFRKPKQKDPALEMSGESVAANRLKDLCEGDADLYGALSRLMFLDPKKITTSIEQAVSDGQAFEKQGDKLRAEVNYRIAGGIALSRGDPAGVRTYFEKAASMASDSKQEYQVLLKRSDQAVNIARRFYEEFGSISTLS
jgi:hypothetical protein